MALSIIASFAGLSAEAGATFPGRNGEIALTGDRDILMVDPESGRARSIAHFTDYPPSGYSWSPDGRELIYHRHWGIFITNPRGTETEVIEDYSGAHSPVFEADGDSFLFTKQGGDFFLYLYSWDRSTGESTPLAIAGSASYPAVSPNGERMTYYLRTQDGYSLMLADPDGSDAEVLMEGVSGGSFSPDSTSIVVAGSYRSKTYKEGELYIQKLDGSPPELLKTSWKRNIWSAEFSPDGNQILYQRGRRLSMVPLDGGRERTIRVRSPLLRHGFYGETAWRPRPLKP